MPKAFFKIFEQFDKKFVTGIKCDLIPVVFIKQPLQKFNLKVIVSTHLNIYLFESSGTHGVGKWYTKDSSDSPAEADCVC